MKINWTHFLIIFFTCFLFLISILLYSKNYLILGGEGNYYINFELSKGAGSFAWVSVNAGTGASSPTLNGLAVIFDFFSLLQKLGASLKLVNTILIFLVYTLPFLSMMWMLHKTIKVNFFTSYILSLFYVLNPFSTYHLQGLMFWNTAPLFVLPIIFGCIYKYYFKKFKLFLLFGFLTALFAFSFSNIPYLGIFHIFLFISIIIIPYIRTVKFDLKIILRNLFISELSFILFNAWWFINLLRFQMQDLKNYYTSAFAIGWAISAAGTAGIMERIFSLKTLVMNERGNFFSDLYNSFPISIVLFIPFLLIIWNLFKETGEQKNTRNKGTVLVFGFILIVLFLNKGVNEPFIGIYLWLLNYIPFFIIFKSPLEKFSVLLVFLLTIALVQVFRNTKLKWPYYLITIYLMVCSIPYVTLNLFPEYKFEQSDKYISKQYLDKKGYFEARQLLNNNKLDYRVLSLPGSDNYQVTILNHDGNKYYRGMDPFMYSVNKPLIAAYTSPMSNLDYIFTNFSNAPVEEGLLNIYNIKQIAIDKDMYPAFGFREKESVKKLIEIFSAKNKEQRFDPMQMFKRDNFLPHFYTPQTLITTTQPLETLPEIVSQKGYDIRSAIYFNSKIKVTDNKIKIKFNPNELKKKTVINTPVLEFKKIDPTKYRIVVHGARGEFPLVFSESFHEGWNAYISNIKLNSNNQISNYKIIDGNSDDQASGGEVKSFIDNGWVTTLGDGKEKEIKHVKWENDKEVFDYSEKYKIDFISKNFQDTIQNDNLPSGPFYETWFKKPIDNNKNHSLVNGYANSWLINTETLCSTQSNCKKNADGSYDFEVVVEFWPQKLFYIGLAISGVTLVGCLLYLAWSWARRKKLGITKNV